MPLSKSLGDFQACLSQCESLIANAHQTDAAGKYLFSEIDRQQITSAAFLNMFIAWEGFLESSLVHLMAGHPTISGQLPVRHVVPPTIEHAASILKGVLSYFPFSDHGKVLLVVRTYFDNGYPFEPHISSIYQDLSDMKTVRNSCAHIDASTQTPLAALAMRITGTPAPKITVYELLTGIDPRVAGRTTVFASQKAKLAVAAELIAQG